MIARIIGRIFGFWSWVRRWWNLVRPGWPVPTLTAIGCLALVFSGQGQEVLFAVSDWRDEYFWFSFAAVAATSVLLYGIFLVAICDYYPAFSDRALQGIGARLWSAALVGVMVPVTLTLHYGVGWLTAITSRSAAAVDVARAWPPALASLAVLAALLFVFFVVGRNWLRLFPSPFSIIMVVSSRLRWMIGFCVGFGIVIAALTVLDARVARLAGPMAIVLFGLTMWAAGVTRIVAWFQRRDLIPAPFLAVLLVVLVAIFGGVRSQVELRNATEANIGGPIPQVVAVDRQVDAWLGAHPARDGEVRAIVVLAEGGGIRSALQSASVMAELEARGGEGFYNDLYALSGVSGGSVGLSAYLAARAERSISRVPPPPGRPPRRERAIGELIHSFFVRDHFSPLLAGMFFVDTPMSFLPIPQWGFIPDRSQIFENSFSQALGAMRRPVLNVLRDAAPSSGVSPIFLSSTVRANDGVIDVVSNVRFANVAGAGRICNVLDRVQAGRTLSLASAAHLSARFPLISPPGAMPVGRPPNAEDWTQANPCYLGATETVRYVDGGYLDNSGALAARAAVLALQAGFRRRYGEGPRAPRLNVAVLHIFARSVVRRESGGSNDFMPDLTAPLDALVGVRNVQGLGPVENLCRLIERAPANSAPDAPSVDVCGQLAAFRVLRHRASDGQPIDRDIVLAAYRPTLSWINQPLEVDESNFNNSRYVPLGWLLGRSRDYVQQSAHRSADEAWACALRHASGPGDVEDCPATGAAP